MGDGNVHRAWTMPLILAGSALKLVTGVNKSDDDAMPTRSAELKPFPTPIVAMKVPFFLIAGATSTPCSSPAVSAPSVMRMITRGSDAEAISESHARRPFPDEVVPPVCLF